MVTRSGPCLFATTKYVSNKDLTIKDHLQTYFGLLCSANTFSYDTVDVLGWGTTNFAGSASATLQKINLMVVNNQDCQTDYQGVATINAGQMCTYDYSGNSRDSCQYDSGGPVIKRQTQQFLVGIISFGKSCASTPYAMGVNTRVTTYINWIRQKIGYSNCVVTM